MPVDQEVPIRYRGRKRRPSPVLSNWGYRPRPLVTYALGVPQPVGAAFIRWQRNAGSASASPSAWKLAGAC